MNEKKNEAVFEKKIFETKSYVDDKEYFIMPNLEFESKSDDIENGNFNSIYKENHKKNKKEDNILYSEKIRCKRILIEFSLIILIISFICLFGYFFIIKQSYMDIDLILQTKTLHFHCNFVLLYAVWIIVGLSIIISIIRFIFINEERSSTLLKNINKFEEDKITLLEHEIEKARTEYKSNNSSCNVSHIQNYYAASEIPKIVKYYPNSKSEILDIIYSKIDFWYYLGNFFFAFLTFSVIVHKHFDFEGDFFPSLLGILSITSYTSAYLKIKSRRMREALNIYSLSMKISFILALNFIILCIFLIKYLETQDMIVFNLSIDQCCIYIYFIILCSEVVLMVYFKDVYFVLIMIIFKSGVVIDNLHNYKKNNKFTLIYFLLTLFFFISYLILKLFNENEDEFERKETEKLDKAYKDQLFVSKD